MGVGQAAAFGDRLRHRRIANGLTQEELAERSGVSARSIGDIERGVSRAPHKETAALLAVALGLAGDERAAFEAAARRRAAAASPAAQAQPRPTAAADNHPDGPPSPRLVGRERELALLERHLAGDAPPVFVLAGEPGLGKS